MSTFPLSQDDYSVEEISYDDMMAILSTQKKEETDFEAEISETADVRQNDISQRISENAKQQLPDWLINN